MPVLYFEKRLNTLSWPHILVNFRPRGCCLEAPLRVYIAELADIIFIRERVYEFDRNPKTSAVKTAQKFYTLKVTQTLKF